MIRQLDRVWFLVLDQVHRWVVHEVVAYCERDRLRGAEAQRRAEAMHRLEKCMAAQKRHLN